MGFDLPGAVDIEFPGNDIPVGTIELSRLAAPTWHAFDRYFEAIPDYREYNARLPGARAGSA